MNADRVIALRTALGWSQNELARVLAVNIQTVRRWEYTLSQKQETVVGLAHEVLVAIEHAVYHCGGDRELIAKVARRLELGLGAMIARGIEDLLAGRGRMPPAGST